MTAAANEALVRHAIDAMNAHDLEAWLACFSDDVAFHALHFQPVVLPGGGQQGKEAMRQGFASALASCPDSRFTIEHLVAADEFVATFGVQTGTHEGQIFGEAPTHGQLSVAWADYHRIAGGLIAEVWSLGDRAGWWQQVGLIPPTREILPVLRAAAPVAGV